MLSEWLKQIVIIVLIASFVDLLLPNRSMQRYVKLVISLFVLISILNPLLQWIGVNTTLSFTDATIFTRDSTFHMPQLNEVLTKADKLKAGQDEQSIHLVTNRIEAMIIEQVHQTYGYQSVEAKVNLEKMNDGKVMLQQIYILILDNPNENLQENQHQQSIAIDPIKINLDVKIATHESKSFFIRDTNQSEQIAISDRIENTIAQQWMMPAENVEVQFKERG
jgi:stage III sporulation protein AF